MQEDEHDEGKRSILNLGHTFGHALEKATKFQKYLHGEAVAIGLAVALHLALRLGLVCAAEVTQVLALMDCWGLPTNFPGALTEEVYSLLSTDKKVARGKIHYVLPVGIGQVTIKKDLPAEIVRETLWEASFLE